MSSKKRTAEQKVRKVRAKATVDKQRHNNGRNAKGQFEKGNGLGFASHPECINRNGRPKSHDELRTLIQEISERELTNGRTLLADMIFNMLVGRDARDHANILEHGWGKVPQDLNVNVKDLDNAIESELARLAGRSQTQDAGSVEREADTGEPGNQPVQP